MKKLSPLSKASIPQALATSLPWLLLSVFAVPAFAQTGRIESGQITSDALANNLLGDTATRPFRVYLPPGYATTARRFPVIYVLHGYTQNESSLVGTLQGSLDALIRQRRIGEMIAVFVNGANRLHLQGAGLYILSPRLSLSYAANTLELTFPTQTGVEYTIESRGALGTSFDTWKVRTSVTGNDRPAELRFPTEGNREFFRVGAANISP